MKSLADCLKLAAASAVITLLAMALRMSDPTRLAGSVLLLFAPPTSIVAIVYAIRDLKRKPSLWPQIVLALILSLLPLVAMYQIQF